MGLNALEIGQTNRHLISEVKKNTNIKAQFYTDVCYYRLVIYDQ